MSTCLGSHSEIWWTLPLPCCTRLWTSVVDICYLLSAVLVNIRVHGLWRVISQRWTFSWHVPSRCYQTVSWITSFLRQSPPVQCSPLRTPGQLLTPVALTTLQPCRYPSRPMWENFCGYFWPFFSFLPFSCSYPLACLLTLWLSFVSYFRFT